MSERRERGRGDPELRELFRDDPEGLALLDAIANTQRAKRLGRQYRYLIAAALTVVAAVAITLGFFSAGSKADVIGRAAKAIDVDPVLHLALVEEHPLGEVVDLRTLKSSEVHHRLDEWFDRHTRVRQVRDSVGDVVVGEARVRVPMETSAEAARFNVTSFIDAYERALTERAVAKIEKGTVDDNPVYWLELRDSSAGERVFVALDQETLHGVALRLGRRYFHIVLWQGLSAVPAARTRTSRRVALSDLDPSPVVTQLRQVRRLPPLRSVIRKAMAGGRTLELRFSAAPIRGKFVGRYLRLVMFSGDSISQLTAVERAVRANELLILGARPVQAFGRTKRAAFAIETTLPKRVAIKVGRALVGL